MNNFIVKIFLKWTHKNPWLDTGKKMFLNPNIFFQYELFEFIR